MQTTNGSSAASVPADFAVTIKDRTIRVADLLPLPSGVWRRELKAYGLDLMRMNRLVADDKLEIDHLSAVALVTLRRAEPSLTMEDIDDHLTFRQVQLVAKAAIEAEGDRAPQALDRPTSSDSSGSPSAGGGGQTSSTA